MKQLHMEIIYQGEHCPHCYYMREAVQTIAPRFGDQVRWTLIEYTKSKVHARRFYELSLDLYGREEVHKRFRCAPIPSLFFDGKLVFDVIPRLDELEESIKRYLNNGEILACG
ncbi:MAG: hypothetical protein HY788_22830 [Deltaproteobacteria bacterium]|nr:hypothetical protein [Deltaproteobacteria bacterium]